MSESKLYMNKKEVRSRVAHSMRRDEEIAALAVYLSSKAADFTNGQDITVDGGVNIVNP